ncbi:UNVERIFIED_CONTAM: hypothetical protein FKN15_059292 [Acipenser sinensis]
MRGEEKRGERRQMRGEERRGEGRDERGGVERGEERRRGERREWRGEDMGIRWGQGCGEERGRGIRAISKIRETVKSVNNHRKGLGVGVILSLGAVGQLSTPIMELLQRSGYFLHHVLYSSLALLCVLSIMLLPETKRKPLPQSLRDGELYRRPPLLRGRSRRDHVPLLCTPNPAI